MIEEYNIVVTMWDGGTPYERHFVKHKYGQPKWYVMSISLDAYRNRENRKCAKMLPNGGCQVVMYQGKRGSLQFNDEYESTKRANDKFGIHQELPEFYHDAWFDFYKAVGYDYKRKKYLTEE